MADDPIVAEVRAARARLSERFGHDLKKIAEYLKKREKEGGRKVVNRSRKPAKG